MNELSLDHLRRVLEYDKDSGDFTWLASSHKWLNGKKAGSIRNIERNGIGYWVINIKNKNYPAHRLAWFYEYGKWPENFIDHIDGNTINNRISNLRDATHSQNMRNRKPCGISGIKNVNWRNRDKKWTVQFKIDGESKSFGTFKTIEEAKAVADRIRLELHGEYSPILAKYAPSQEVL